MSITTYSYPRHAKAIHFGLAVFGITAYLTAELAEANINTWEIFNPCIPRLWLRPLYHAKACPRFHQFQGLIL